MANHGSGGCQPPTTVADSVAPPCRIHDLRHTHAAWLIADGEHPKAIQARLGRGSIAVTMDRYGYLRDGLGAQIASTSTLEPELPRPQRAPNGTETLPASGSERAETLALQGPTHEEIPRKAGDLF